VSGVTYNIYRDTTSGFTPSSSNKIASPSASSYQDTGLIASTTYYYVVEAVNSAGSAAAAQVSATTSASSGTAPAAPTGVSAVAVSATQVNLVWTQVSGVTYNVYRDVTSGFTPSSTNQITSGLSTATYVDSTVPALGTYYYVVEADNGSGTADSAEVSVETVVGASAAGYSLASLGVPQYQCNGNNYYLDPAGSDSNDGLTTGTAWATMWHADGVVQPGDCVTLGDGIYPLADYAGASHGGNDNSPTGYVVYKAATPGGAILQASQAADATWKPFFSIQANYLIFDGIVFDANNMGYYDCITEIYGPQHHLVIENSTIKGCTRSGIEHSWYGIDYTWTVNNNIEFNGSTNVPDPNNGGALPGGDAAVTLYEPKSATLTDSSFSPNTNDGNLTYHHVIAFNNIHDNIYPDTALDPNGNVIAMKGILIYKDYVNNYTDKILIVGNTVYNNSGQGILLFNDSTSNITVANNSTYNNNTQTSVMSDQIQDKTTSISTSRGEITCDTCANTTIVNNATYAVTSGGGEAANNVSYFVSATSTPTFNTNIGNLSFGTGVDPTTLGSGNLLNTDPQFNAPATGDFSLATGSPALGAGTAEPWLTTTPANIGWQQ